VGKILLYFSMGVVILVAGIVILMLLVSQESHPPVWTVPNGDPDKGKQLIVSYGCFSCHAIGGIREAKGRVGPKLMDIQEQIYIGGVLPNSADSMISWIIHPQQFSPRSAMPDLGVSENQARDITAYLFKPKLGDR
jgi:cytochrome c2